MEAMALSPGLKGAICHSTPTTPNKKSTPNTRVIRVFRLKAATSQKRMAVSPRFMKKLLASRITVTASPRNWFRSGRVPGAR